MMGGTPTTEEPTHLAMIFSPSFSATSRRHSVTADAPSEIWDELPAVPVPFSLKTVLSLASDSMVVCGRMPSSFEMTTSSVISGLSPSAGVTLRTLIGTISSASRPSSCAALAFWCDCTANSSWRSRGMLYFSATASDVEPIGRRQSRASFDSDFLIKGEMPAGIALVCYPGSVSPRSIGRYQVKASGSEAAEQQAFAVEGQGLTP